MERALPRLEGVCVLRGTAARRGFRGGAVLMDASHFLCAETSFPAAPPGLDDGSLATSADALFGALECTEDDVAPFGRAAFERLLDEQAANDAPQVPVDSPSADTAALKLDPPNPPTPTT